MADKFLMTDSLIRKQEGQENGLNQTECLHIMGASRSGYHAWRKRREKESADRQKKQDELEKLMGLFRKVIHKLGFVPGKRTFKVFLWRDYQVNISLKRCQRIMKIMNLKANRPKKDPYKHQATHDHPCAAPANLVNQDFYIGPRKVVLTDITYLYYGQNRTTFYMCAFKDAFTREILGHATGSHMTTGLVKAAYDKMMTKHGNQLHGADCIIHSDQGSQYLSTTFKKILEDDEFLQSVSGRGNSQDNAPMESFFGKMKREVMDLIALCPDEKTASRLVDGYVDAYNHAHYQYALAGLTPCEYYTYVTSGIYPLDNYYGVKADEMMTIDELVKKRQELAAKKAEKVRKSYQNKNLLKKDAELIVRRDQHILIRAKAEQEELKKESEEMISYFETVFQKTESAIEFLKTLGKEALEELKCPQAWQKYKELDYIYDMAGLF